MSHCWETVFSSTRVRSTNRRLHFPRIPKYLPTCANKNGDEDKGGIKNCVTQKGKKQLNPITLMDLLAYLLYSILFTYTTRIGTYIKQFQKNFKIKQCAFINLRNKDKLSKFLRIIWLSSWSYFPTLKPFSLSCCYLPSTVTINSTTSTKINTNRKKHKKLLFNNTRGRRAIWLKWNGKCHSMPTFDIYL